MTSGRYWKVNVTRSSRRTSRRRPSDGSRTHTGGARSPCHTTQTAVNTRLLTLTIYNLTRSEVMTSRAVRSLAGSSMAGVRCACPTDGCLCWGAPDSAIVSSTVWLSMIRRPAHGGSSRSLEVPQSLGRPQRPGGAQEQPAQVLQLVRAPSLRFHRTTSVKIHPPGRFWSTVLSTLLYEMSYPEGTRGTQTRTRVSLHRGAMAPPCDFPSPGVP